MSYDNQIFGDKTFGNLLEEIHKNANEKKFQINALIGELKGLIESIGDATLVVPLLKEYLDIGVRNDEQLIKLATIIQRIETASAKGDGSADLWSPQDLMDLLEETEEKLPFQEVKDAAKAVADSEKKDNGQV